MATDVTLCNRALQKIGAQPITTLADENESARNCNRIYSDIVYSELRANNWNFATKRASLTCTVSITAVTTASPAVFTATSHGLSIGDYVYITGLTWTTSGDPIPAGVYVVATASFTANAFSLTDEGAVVASTGYTWSSGGTVNLATPWGYTAAFALPSACLRVIELDNYFGLSEAIGSFGKTSPDFRIEENRILTNSNGTLDIRYIEKITVTAGTAITPDPDPLFQEALVCKIGIEICEALTEDNGKKNQLWQEYKLAISRAKQCDAIETPPESMEEDDWLNARI